MPEINVVPTTYEASPMDAYRRKILAAQLMQKQAADASQPLYNPGLIYAKALQGGIGGAMEGMADREEMASQKEGASLAAQLYAMDKAGAAQPAAPAAPAQAASPAPAAAPVPQSNTVGKIYNNDEPSPLDPPSGADRDRAVRTVVAEAGNQGPVGQGAVASVIRNRAVDGGYGGDTPGGVVTAKNQFEPWNTAAGRARMAALDPNSVAYKSADAAIASAYGEGGQAPNDPTNGAKNFIQPNLQTSMGRPMPSWAQGPGQMIGDHKFIGGAPQPAPVQTASADPNFVPQSNSYAPDQSQPPAQPPQASPVPQDRPQMMAQALSPQQPPDSAPSERQALLAKVMGNPHAMKMLMQLKALEPTPIKLGEGENLYNPTTYKPLTNNGPKTTDEIREYNLYKTQGGQKTFEDYKIGLKQAGATRVSTSATVDQKPELAFDTEAGKLQAKRFDELASDGQNARQMVSDVKTLTDLGKNIGTGKAAEVKAALGPYAQALGIDIKGLDDIQAYEAIVNRVAPNLRVKGSGAQSDLELKNFLKSLPSLGNTPEGNAIAGEVLTGLQENKIRASEIGSKALTKEISRSDAEKQLRELPDPMTNYRKYMEANRGAPTSTGTTAAVPDRAALEAEARRRGLLK